MPLLLSDIAVLGSLTTIQIASTNESLNGIFLQAGTTNLFQGSGGTPTIDIREWEFDAAATSSNPVVVQVQGAEVTFVVDNSVPDRITAGEIVFEAVDPFWTPDQIFGAVCVFDFMNSSRLDTSTGWVFSDEIGNIVLDADGTTPPTLDLVAGGLVFTGQEIDFVGPDFPWDFDRNALRSWFYASFASVSNGGGLFTTRNTAHSIYLQDEGEAISLSRDSFGAVLWDGLLDVNGDPQEIYYDSGGNSAVGVPHRHGVAGSPIPGNTPTFFAAQWRSRGNSNALESLGEPGDSDFIIRKMGIIRDYDTVTTDDKLRLQGYLAWDLINAGLAPIDDLLPSNHPYYSGPPTLGGGGTSSFSIVTPQTTFTVINIPLGAEVRIYDYDATEPDFGTELSGIEAAIATTFAYAHTKAGDRIVVQVFANGFKEFNEVVELLSVSQNFDPALEVEDNF